MRINFAFAAEFGMKSEFSLVILFALIIAKNRLLASIEGN